MMAWANTYAQKAINMINRKMQQVQNTTRYTWEYQHVIKEAKSADMVQNMNMVEHSNSGHRDMHRWKAMPS